MVEQSDLYKQTDWSTFRSTFGLPAGTLTTSHPGGCADPGVVAGDDAEATLDAEWAGAAAPGATLWLESCTSVTLALVNLVNETSGLPTIISVSYGASELDLEAAGNLEVYDAYQQAAGEGISVFAGAGDSGGDAVDLVASYAHYGLNVSGLASTPYNVAVGGTDFADTYTSTTGTYWSSANGTYYNSAKSYIPEIPWNSSCAGVLWTNYKGFSSTYGADSMCNEGASSSSPYYIYFSTAAGGGGPSSCATGAPSTSDAVSGTCAGYAKPSWQSGLYGNPSDGVRDVPDVSLFAGNGIWGHSYVICLTDTSAASGGTATCDLPLSGWAGGGGTSFSTPIMAGVQALANQASNGQWGNPNLIYYGFAKAQYGSSGDSSCDASLGNGVGSSCVFYDVVQILLNGRTSVYGGDTAVPCSGPNCYLPSGGGTYGVLSTAGQKISGITLTAAGSGYTSAPTCAISGGGGSDATCTATVASGAVSKLTLSAAGSGYTSLPTCALSGGGGTGATCTVSTTNSSASDSPAYIAAPGYDFTTGIGTVNVGNLVANFSRTLDVPTELNLGTVLVGSSTYGDVSVQNNSGGNIYVAGAAIIGTQKGDFPGDWAIQSDGCTGKTLGYEVSCTVRVTFTPTAAGGRNAQLQFTDTASNNPQIPGLMGIGNNPVPTIASVDPSSFPAGNPQTPIDITGTNYVSTSTATYNGVAHTVKYDSSTHLQITLSSSDLATGGTFPVVVTNPAPGGGASNSMDVTVNNPKPSITSFSPASLTVGAAAQTLTITGTNFVSTSTVTYHSVAHTATYLSATKLTIPLTTSDLAAAGTYAVQVTNPAPGGGASSNVNFTVNNPQPAVTSFSPTSLLVGATSPTITINGTNFVTGATVTYGTDAARAATYVSATQLTFTLTTADLAAAKNYPVIVTNPSPSAGSSTAVDFPVDNPKPTISSFSPTSLLVGAASQTLTINGTNFVSGATVTYGTDAARAATYVSATKLTITLTTADLATAKDYPVIVTNPSPSAGSSTAVDFPVDNPKPTITNLSPTSAAKGAAAQTLTINGTNFLSTSTVTYNAVAHTATYVSSTKLTIPLTTGDQATAGTFPVVVSNPTPGGGASTAVNFTVTSD
jgi:hypothetical protein